MAYKRNALREIIFANLGDFPVLDALGAAISDTTTASLTAGDYTNYGDGQWIEFASGELTRVKTDPTSSTVGTWPRGMMGTTAATQTSGSLVRINPKFFQWQLNSDINDCLTNRVLKTTYNATAITTVAATRKYDLPAAIKIERINTVYIYNSDNTKRELIRRFRVLKGTGTAGVDELEFLDVHTATRYIGIEYLAGYTALTDDTTNCSLPDTETAQLIPTYWSTAQRLATIEVPRLRKDKGTFKKSGTPYQARSKTSEYWVDKFAQACRSAGLHPNIPGHGPITVSYPIISEY